jgi:hypothetical protein
MTKKIKGRNQKNRGRPFREGFAFSPPTRNYNREITANTSENDYNVEPGNLILKNLFCHRRI